jgi:hypothetical protein
MAAINIENITSRNNSEIKFVHVFDAKRIVIGRSVCGFTSPLKSPSF